MARKAYSDWHHILVTPSGAVHVMDYDITEASLKFYELGGKLFRSMPGGIYPVEPMLLDLALRFRKGIPTTPNGAGST